jgi:hypothetical protein
VSGAVLRVVRSYPEDFVVHVISSDGTTQVRGFGLCQHRACVVVLSSMAVLWWVWLSYAVSVPCVELSHRL